MSRHSKAYQIWPPILDPYRIGRPLGGQESLQDRRKKKKAARDRRRKGRGC